MLSWTHLVALRDDHRGRSFLPGGYAHSGNQRIAELQADTHDKLLRSIVELRTEVQGAPLELVELLVLLVRAGSRRVLIEARVLGICRGFCCATGRHAGFAVARASGSTGPTLLGAVFACGGLGMVLLWYGLSVICRGGRASRASRRRG